jgi:hypothetical protein
VKVAVSPTTEVTPEVAPAEIVIVYAAAEAGGCDSIVVIMALTTMTTRRTPVRGGLIMGLHRR